MKPSMSITAKRCLRQLTDYGYLESLSSNRTYRLKTTI